MTQDLLNADSRELSEPFANKLMETSPEAAFEWLARLLEQQRPSLRSPNSVLLGYTGCPRAIDWLEDNVASPVTTHWGVAAALLGTPWPRIVEWLNSNRSKQLMALDTLYAYRPPSPNMSALEQIAAPALPDAPSRADLESMLNSTLEAGSNVRMRQTTEWIISHASEILNSRERGVPVSEMPQLYINPEAYSHAEEVLERHDSVVSNMKKMLRQFIKKQEDDNG